MDIYEKLGFVLLGAIISGALYLIKRMVEKKPQSDKLDRQRKVLEINKQLSEQCLSIEDLCELENALTGKSELIGKASRLIENETQSLVEKTDGEFLSQAALNIRADANLKISKARLEQTLNELSFKIDEIEREALYESQKAWEEYSEKQAESASIGYRGGSIYPLIYLSELESLTVERAARLQVELDELKRLGN
ncbi:MAG: lysozyme inhibitor LprI family protein [Gammaproteobacteria bacterium]|nr:lysozyme inhibitor LprI family protein [Gammaproteobacteria bacterium]